MSRFRLSSLRILPLILLATASGVARADTHWVVNATFTDGATIKGFFDLNVYGQLSGFDLKTSASNPFSGFEFKPGQGYISPSGGGLGATSLTFYGSTYNGDQVTLEASKSLTSKSFNNTLLLTSFECQNSFSCPSSGDVRYLGAVTALPTPEPPTWAIALSGFGAVGCLARRRRALISA